MKFTFRSPVRSGSGSSGSSSRYGSTKSSGYGTTSSGYGSSSGYGGYTGSTGTTSSYDSSYTPSRTPTYGSGVGGYGSSNYSSSYGTSNYSAGTGYGGSSAIGRSSARDYDAGSNANNAYTSSAYTSRASRDRSSERSLDNIYTPRASRRSAREAEKKEHKVVNVNDMIYKSHRRNGSNTSINSDVFEETKPGVTRSRESSLRTKPAKRDLEAILGKEDHMLVQRIIEENKATIEEAHAQLTSQEEKLIKKIMEVSMTGNSIDCLDILTIIESC